MASARPREATPPPVIGKAGRYTVFITPPPATPKDPESGASLDGASASPGNLSPLQAKPTPSRPLSLAKARPPAPLAEVPRTSVLQVPPCVQVPPQQFEKTAAKDSGSLFGFFRDAVVRVQDAHSNLDEFVAEWFGLNQSKYQWAINDYYDHHGKEIEGVKVGANQKQLVNKGQAV